MKLLMFLTKFMLRHLIFLFSFLDEKEKAKRPTRQQIVDAHNKRALKQMEDAWIESQKTKETK